MQSRLGKFLAYGRLELGFAPSGEVTSFSYLREKLPQFLNWGGAVTLVSHLGEETGPLFLA